jgi:sec-independent protein translocase protein TatC
VIFIVAAILTPPDVISQLCLGIPMVILFEAGLVASKFLERDRAKPTKSTREA